MNKLKRAKHQNQAGYLNIILGSALLVISILNLYTNITRREDVFTILLMSVPFILLFVLSLLINTKSFISLMCLVSALYSAFTPEVAGDYSASVFFMFSFHLYQKKLYAIFLLVLSITSIALNSSMIGHTVNLTIGLIVGYGVVYILYYFILFKRKKRRVDLWKEISEKEKAILKLFMNGKDYAQISHILNINDKKESIRTAITRCRIKSECENDIQFGIWLSDKG